MTSATHTDPGASTRRVLVVDDNVDAADALAMFMETLGVEVRTAYGGAEALDAAGAFLPHLVLLDLGMPDVDGYEVARRIRAMPWGASVTLAALSGWDRDEDRRKTQEAGFDTHLVKPVRFETLERLVASSRAQARAAKG